ncbi:MAG TPA: hypothetical protein VLX89_06280 [Actinomycetota bacterium]|nr:hypothetical protein [Actinomycetota bacterium]
MTERTAHRLAWTIWIVGVVASVGATVFQIARAGSLPVAEAAP